MRNPGCRDHPLRCRVHDGFLGGEVGTRKKVAQVFAHCGGGFDWVFSDTKDMAAPDCERVADRPSKFQGLFESILQSIWEGLPQF